MLLRKGQWLGRGSLLVEGASLGEQLEVDVEVEEDAGGFTLSGSYTLKDAPQRELSIRIAANEVGTYSIDARVGGVAVDGVAKLESVPNLGLLWNAGGTQHATFTLFNVSNGYGFRGFLREGESTFTWEVAFALKQHAVKGDNVIPLTRRRR